MMNLDSVTDILNNKGFRRSVSPRPTEEGLDIIDFTHRKRMDMFSAYVDVYGSVKFVEHTKIKWDSEARRNVPIVTKYYGLKEFVRAV